jgi:hypothetical protein
VRIPNQRVTAERFYDSYPGAPKQLERLHLAAKRDVRNPRPW